MNIMERLFGVPRSAFWRISRKFFKGDKYGAVLDAKMLGFRLFAQKLQQRID